MAFIDDIKRSYLQGSMLLRLIFINIGVFLLLHVLALGALLVNVQGGEVLQWLELPSDLGMLLRRPWTLVTYMFAHYGMLHILFNMLWLYWLGRIFMEFFSPKQLTGVYLLGGWGGALLFLLAYNLLPHLAAHQYFLIGASASVIAIVVATAVYTPNYPIGLLFLGEVPLKWVAIVTVAIDLLSMEGGNLGSSIAHIGGALVGALYALRRRCRAILSARRSMPLSACSTGVRSSAPTFSGNARLAGSARRVGDSSPPVGLVPTMPSVRRNWTSSWVKSRLPAMMR